MNTKDRTGEGVSLRLGRLAHLFAALAISSLLLSFGAIPALAAGPSGHVQSAAATSDSAGAHKSAGAVALNEDDDEDDDDDDEDTEGEGGGGGLPATDTVGAASTQTGGVSPLSLGALAIAGVVAGAMSLNRKRASEESGS
jgi:hypothetical protein